MKEFSYRTRTENIYKLKTEEFDVLIIGGGITGAGVARDAAMRGLKVALIEGRDFAFGTSSRSSKLIHGGIRYLENFEFKLVFEALSERSKLFEMAPHLVHPLRFMIPLFKNSRVGPFKMGLGMMLYDLLALFQTPELHERLGKNNTMERMPIVRNSDLVGSVVYSDAYMDDDRLVHETLRSANEAGACIVNYTSAIKSDFMDGKISSIIVEDVLARDKFFIRAKQVVCTVGPWTDLVGEKLVSDWKKILRPTKGIHLTLAKNRLPLSSAVVMAAQTGNRIVFAIPRHEMIIIGTTDTDFTGDPADATADYSDVEYLLRITNEYFPDAKLTEADVISSYVGVRPLVKDDSGDEGKISREHAILTDPRGFIFVAGGKYTTYRLMAEQIVDRVLKNLPIEQRLAFKPCETDSALNRYVSAEKLREAQFAAVTNKEAWLADRYGMEAFEIMKKYGKSMSYWQLEAYQAIHSTMCLNVLDFCTRRVPLMLAQRDHGLTQLEEIVAVFKKELILTNAEVEKQKDEFRKYIAHELAWREKFKT